MGIHRPFRMHLYMWPIFLATLVQSSPFSSLSSNSDACSDFTVGWCFYTDDVWWISTRTSVTGGFVSHCVIPRMDVTTSAGPNIVRNVKCTPSLKIVTESEEP